MKRLILYFGIILVIVVLMIIATTVFRNNSERVSIALVPDTIGVIEDSIAEVTGQALKTTSLTVPIETAPSDTVSGKKVADTLHVAVTNPLESALKKGLPVVADFGRGTCVPCKMMEPILEKLESDFEGKASVLILDIREYSALSQKYGITLIPTQIFFDTSGAEVFRHQGFMPEEDIVLQLREMGVE